MNVTPELKGARLMVRPFTADDVGPRYLGWLSDPVVNRMSQRRGAGPVSAEQALAYLNHLQPDEAVLAILCPEHGHVGNIKYGPIDAANSRSDISILIGEQKIWGRGYGTEAIYLLSRWLFEERGLNRVDAGSANPAFLGTVAKLGWTVEGVLRQRVRLGGEFVDWTLIAQLRGEFVRRAELESAGG